MKKALTDEERHGFESIDSHMKITSYCLRFFPFMERCFLCL